MKPLTDRFLGWLGRFWRRDDGIMAAELILVLPIFMFCTITLYSYWDAFRALNASQKASYTVSDMIARTMQPVNTAYIDGLRSTMQYMIGDTMPVSMRVTSVTWSAVRNRYEVEWSHSPNGRLPPLNTTTLQPFAQHIPILMDGDSVIVMETNTQFRPAFARTNFFSLYLDPEDFRQFIVTRPRFVPHICMVGVACG